MSGGEDNSLPAGFQDLEPLVPYWAGVTPGDRWDRRARASMEDIRAFYDIMVQRTDAALKYLQPKPLEELEGADARLFRLVLALAHVAMAVELHKQPRAPFSPYPHGIEIVKGPGPFA